MAANYSQINYWTPGWIYPRESVREPFPRKRFLRATSALFPRPAPNAVLLLDRRRGEAAKL